MHIKTWLGDAIYGVNDGLAAIFGIIAGVSGFTNSHRMILVSGLFGAIASTLSMGAGAWLAARSENEVKERDIVDHKRHFTTHVEEYISELVHDYEQDGFTHAESLWIVERLSKDPERFLHRVLTDHTGWMELHSKNPWHAMFFAGISTLIGAFIPLIPLFFFTNSWGFMLAAIVSIIAHYVVGAVKSWVTLRPWWQSGLEMMMVGILVGVISYGLGSMSAWFI